MEAQLERAASGQQPAADASLVATGGDIEMATISTSAASTAADNDLFTPRTLHGIDPVAFKRVCDFDKRFGFLYETYKANRYWFEPIALLRRALLLGINVVLFNDPIYRSQAFVLHAVIAFLFHVLVLPFRSAIDNLLETASLFTLCCLSAFQAGVWTMLRRDMTVLVAG